jgi:hypothetical protein
MTDRNGSDRQVFPRFHWVAFTLGYVAGWKNGERRPKPEPPMTRDQALQLREEIRSCVGRLERIRDALEIRELP